MEGDVNMGIGSKIEVNAQLQEFTEKVLGYTFDLIRYGDLAGEDICEDMGITEEEMYWMFEQLGYERDTK